MKEHLPKGSRHRIRWLKCTLFLQKMKDKFHVMLQSQLSESISHETWPLHCLSLLLTFYFRLRTEACAEQPEPQDFCGWDLRCPECSRRCPADEKVWRLWVLDWCSSWKRLSEYVQLSLLMNTWRHFSKPKSQINKPDSNNSRNLIAAAFHFEAAVVEQKLKKYFSFSLP